MTSIIKRLQLGLVVLIVAFFFIFLSILPVHAEENRKVVMIIIDKISLQDLNNTDLPNLQKLIRYGAIGLMNTNTGATKNASHSYLTIGAGNRAATGDWAGLAFNGSEVYLGNKAEEIYHSISGQKAQPNNLVHLGFAQMIKTCSSLQQTVIPGALGTVLNENNLKTAVIGNADASITNSPQDYMRFAVNIAINDRGVVNYGDVSSNLLEHNKEFPFGLSTNFKKMSKAYKELLNQTQFMVIETGDTARLETYWDYLLTKRIINEKTKTLKRIDKFIGQLLTTIDPKRDLILIVSPDAPKEEILQGNTLTPLLAFGKGIEPGLLISGTTHRKGIVTNLDIAPTIINFFGAKVPYYMSGQSLGSIPSQNTVPFLLKLNKQIVATSNQHGIILKTFVSLQIIMLILALLVILFSSNLPRLFLTMSQAILLGLASVPLILLFLPLLAINQLVLSFSAIVLIASLFVFITRKMARQEIDPLVILGLATSISIFIDITLGSPLMKTSLLGYDPMVGARFYGIGNEYSGVLLGSSILGTTALLQRFPLKKKELFWLISFFFLAIIFVCASPKLGTDVGGTITSIISFSIVYLRIKGKKVNYKVLITIITSVFILLALTIYWDVGNGGSGNTHIGRAASLVEQGGWQTAQQIIQRKLATNWRLIRYTIWTRVLLTSLVALAILFFRPIGVVRRIIQNYPYLSSGFVGILVASIVGLAVNDSGVVQAATTILYGVFPLVYLVVEERRRRK